MLATWLATLGTTFILMLAAPGDSDAQVDCSDPDTLCTGDPCVIGTVTVPPSCVVDFGARSVVIGGSLLIPSGSSLSLSARTITVREKIGTSQAEGKYTEGASVALIASEDVSVNGLIRTSGFFSSGDITVTAGRNFTLAGRLWTAATPEARAGDVVVRAGGTVHVAGPIVTRGSTNADAGDITLSGDDGVLVDRTLDAASGASGFTSYSGGDVDIASANGPVTVNSKITARGSDAGSVKVTAGASITMRGSINLDDTTCSGCTAAAGGVELRSTGGDVELGGRITSKGVFHYSDAFIVDAAGQARITASIRARERGDAFVDGATITVTGNRVSVEAPASFDLSGLYIGGKVRLRGGTVSLGRGTRIRAEGRTVGGGQVLIDATAGAATVGGAVVVGGGIIDPDNPGDYVPGAIQAIATGDLTADGVFRATPAGCIAMRAGGTRDISRGSFDPPASDSCVCGDDIIGGAETCDGSAGCSAGTYCDSSCSACAPRCGDGIIAGSETCESSTGCSAPEICNRFCSACTTCGNGIVDGSEACDGTLGCPGGAYCRGDCSGCFTRCGDGIVGGSEVCDGSAGCDSGICRFDCSVCTPCPPTVAVIPAEGGTFSGTTTGGTTVVSSPCGGQTAPERTFEWTPSVSGTASIQTCGSSYDTVLYIREGGCGGTQLACNDDSCGYSSRIAPSVTAGRTYTIVVDGYGGYSGAFVLTITPPAQ